MHCYVTHRVDFFSLIVPLKYSLSGGWYFWTQKLLMRALEDKVVAREGKRPMPLPLTELLHETLVKATLLRTT